jgi:hypothetical protein
MIMPRSYVRAQPSYRRRTRSARSVFHRLSVPGRSISTRTLNLVWNELWRVAGRRRSAQFHPPVVELRVQDRLPQRAEPVVTAEEVRADGEETLDDGILDRRHRS